MDASTLGALAGKAAAAANLMKTLSSPHRLLILCHLVTANELPAGELSRRVGLSQSALSQHLAVLREEGLVTYRREAQTLHYRVCDPRAAKVLDLLRSIYCPELEPSAAALEPRANPYG
jgi:DNA-binding transcriptional ArsR family regulator